MGFDDKPKSSGYACFRAFFKGDHLRGDPLTAEFVEKECVNIWIGKDKHLVQNTLRNGEEFNWIITHKDTEDIKESWFQPGDMNAVRELVEDCDPRVAAIVRKTESCLDWKICYRDPIPTWVSKNHKVALIGDCCHPHLPTSAQGASQATESAAVLAQCLLLAGKGNVPLAVSKPSPVPTTIATYLSKPRVHRGEGEHSMMLVLILIFRVWYRREFMKRFGSQESEELKRMVKTSETGGTTLWIVSKMAKRLILIVSKSG